MNYSNQQRAFTNSLLAQFHEVSPICNEVCNLCAQIDKVCELDMSILILFEIW